MFLSLAFILLDFPSFDEEEERGKKKEIHRHFAHIHIYDFSLQLVSYYTVAIPN